MTRPVRHHRLATAVVALATVTAAGCSGPSGADDSGPAILGTGAPAAIGDVSPMSPAASASTAATGPADGTAAVHDGPVVGDPVVASEVVGEVERPVDLVARPYDDALYVVGQRGLITKISDGAATVVADLTDRVSGGSEQGLLGLEFSADGTLAYLSYDQLEDDTMIAEYPVAPDGTIDTTSERVLLTVEQPYVNHNGGDIVRSPDGLLWIILGDGGYRSSTGGDPEHRASDPTDLLGSLLRIDPTPSGDRPYTIPPDNPFATGEFNGRPGAPEVWAWGLRNPWKIALDPVTGDLWIADVGHNEWEEVNHVASIGGAPPGRGANFGWSAFEGTQRYDTTVADPGDTVMPVLVYRHGDNGCSVSGGVPYHGTAIAGLSPAYVYSDFCSGIVWALDLAGGRNITLLTGFEQVTAVRTGPDGELYLLEATGKIHRLIPG